MGRIAMLRKLLTVVTVAVCLAPARAETPRATQTSDQVTVEANDSGLGAYAMRYHYRHWRYYRHHRHHRHHWRWYWHHHRHNWWWHHHHHGHHWGWYYGRHLGWFRGHHRGWY
jgi:hypothetical protein